MTYTRPSERFWTCLSTFTVFNTDSRQHVWIDSVQLKEYPQPRGRVPNPLLHSFYSVSLSSQKFLRSASTLWARRHGRMNTCVGCLPGVRLPPVLAARQKSPPKTSAKGKFLTMIFIKIAYYEINRRCTSSILEAKADFTSVDKLVCYF